MQGMYLYQVPGTHEVPPVLYVLGSSSYGIGCSTYCTLLAS
jgi:hypothetical protein